MESIIVQTLDSVRYGYVLQHCIKHRMKLLFCGPTGMGKPPGADKGRFFNVFSSMVWTFSEVFPLVLGFYLLALSVFRPETRGFEAFERRFKRWSGLPICSRTS